LTALFTPAKNSLQKTVDKYFGQAPKPPDLKAYIDQMRSVIEVLDAGEAARKLLEQSVATLDATGGAIFIHGREDKDARIGDFDASGPAVRIPIQHDGRESGYLLLAARGDGGLYDADDLEPLQAAAGLLGHALALEKQPERQRRVAAERSQVKSRVR
jgi:hypothetical protein